MTDSIVKVEHLSHRYTKAWAIKDISFDIRQRGVVGLLGSNGAGKSTTMNIICGVLSQTSGQVYIDGIDMKQRPEAAKKLIGFLPQTLPLHMDLTVDEYLIHCAHLRMIEKSKISPALEDAKQRCGIARFSKRLIRNLSGGYRQRVGIAQAIIHKPKLVILDEPTNGLDPNQIIEVRRLIKDIATERTVIFSSHILAEVQVTCQYVKMIENGRMVFEDTMEGFNNYIQPESFTVYFDAPPAPGEIESIPMVTKVEMLSSHLFRVHFERDDSILNRVVETSVSRGWQLKEISLDKSSLDQIFSELSKKQHPTNA